MRISDWSSDVCSSDLPTRIGSQFNVKRQVTTNPHRERSNSSMLARSRSTIYWLSRAFPRLFSRYPIPSGIRISRKSRTLSWRRQGLAELHKPHHQLLAVERFNLCTDSLPKTGPYRVEI